MDPETDHGRKTQWAERRTDWAEDRTVLANERTFAGWLRTGMAALALALGLRAVFGAFEPTWFAKAVASVFIVVAAFIFWQARRKTARALKRLDEHASKPLPQRHVDAVTALLLTGSIAVGLVLWLL